MPAGSSALKQKHPELLTNAIFRTEAREQAGVTCGKSRAEHRLALPRSTCQAIPPRPGQLPPKREPLAGRAVPRLGEGWGGVLWGPRLPSLLPSALPAASGAPGLGPPSGLRTPQHPGELQHPSPPQSCPDMPTDVHSRDDALSKRRHPPHSPLGTNDTVGFVPCWALCFSSCSPST